jgi:hypothetical protein
MNLKAHYDNKSGLIDSIKDLDADKWYFPSDLEWPEVASGFPGSVPGDYQLLRKEEYPPLADLADALYWQSKGDESKMDEYLANCEAIKLKYPKVT